MIQGNLKLNELDAKVYQLALGDYDGEGGIYFSEGVDFAYSVTVDKDTTSGQAKSVVMPIKVCRAESILNKNKKPLPNLIKIDVETFESEVLQGFGSRFPSDAIFLIEVLNDFIAKKLSQFFPSPEYEFYNINDHAFVLRKTINLEKSDLYNCLIIPKAIIAQFNFDHILTVPHEVSRCS